MGVTGVTLDLSRVQHGGGVGSGYSGEDGNTKEWTRHTVGSLLRRTVTV